MKSKGLFQALGVTAYCSLVGLLVFNGERVFGRMQNYFGPVAFLLLFCVSALICALLVFYQPYRLFFENKKKEAVELVVQTAVWLFVFMVVVLTLAVVM